MILRLITTASLLVAASVAFADNVQMSALDKHQFDLWDAQIRDDFDAGMRYKEITSADQETVTTTLTKMEQVWLRADGNGKLGVSDSVEVGNDQQIVSTILDHAAADSRLVCDRETPMGTTISKKVCRTVAQIKRDQDESQDALRQVQSKGIVTGAGGH